MLEIAAVGLDLAKNVLPAHGADASGRAVPREKLRPDQVPGFLARPPACVVAMGACGGAHVWGREPARLGHEARLVPTAQARPFVKRQENDAAGAGAICQAAQRPAMRFVPLKSGKVPGAAMVLRVRELPIRPRLQAIDALRGHPAELRPVAPLGAGNAALDAGAAHERAQARRCAGRARGGPGPQAMAGPATTPLDPPGASRPASAAGPSSGSDPVWHDPPWKPACGPGPSRPSRPSPSPLSRTTSTSSGRATLRSPAAFAAWAGPGGRRPTPSAPTSLCGRRPQLHGGRR